MLDTTTPHINHLNAEFNPICHSRALLEAQAKNMNAFHVYVYYQKYANFPEGNDISNL
jgi:hypothetical protein